MKKRIYTSVAIVLILALLFVLKAYVSSLFFDFFFVGLACFASFEMSRMMSKMGKFNFIYVVILFPVLYLCTILLGVPYIESSGKQIMLLFIIIIELAISILMTLLLFLYTLLNRKNTREEMKVRGINTKIRKFAFTKSLNTFICFIYPAFAFLFISLINHFEELGFEKFAGVGENLSIFLLLIALIIPMFTDTFAMLTGSLIGGKKLCPKLSPKKTISGSVGGSMWCILLSVAVYLIFTATEAFSAIESVIPVWQFILVVLFGSIISQFGDLLESFLKRKAGIKDSGRFLPGHGGILDRIDSYIIVAPIIFFAFCMIAL